MARHPHWRHLRDDRGNFEHCVSIREPHDPPPPLELRPCCRAGTVPNPLSATSSRNRSLRSGTTVSELLSPIEVGARNFPDFPVSLVSPGLVS